MKTIDMELNGTEYQARVYKNGWVTIFLKAPHGEESFDLPGPLAKKIARTVTDYSLEGDMDE